jgi:acetylornithine deacetylase
MILPFSIPIPIPIPTTMPLLTLTLALTLSLLRGTVASTPLRSPDLLRLHQQLVEIESISGNERAVGDWLSKSLVDQGYHVERQSVDEDPERFNVFAWPGHDRDPAVLLTSHIDTVSAYPSPRPFHPSLVSP